MFKLALLRRAAVLSGILLAGMANGFILDQAKVVISRALSSPTITIRYTGANAALAELRINGVSYATRSLDAVKADGETSFTLDLNSLKEGDNEIEVRLFNRAGKLVASERQLVLTESSFEAPVFIRAPKMGASVFGTINVEVGFGKPMKNTYVSFFIDNEFKSMSNVAPFSFAWDTERVQNGWHDLEAWVVDDTNQTLKTKKVKVFVNNVGGNTERITIKPPQIKPVEKAAAMPAKQVAKAKAAPKPKSQPKAIGNAVAAQAGKPAGLQAVNVDPPLATGPKIVLPKVEPNPKPAIRLSDPGGLTPIKRGTRLPEAGKFSIVLEDKVVKFDVQPRVAKGVPITPFRHLFEQAGGVVNWDNTKKQVDAKGLGKAILITIGDIMARVNGVPVSMEIAPFLENGRTMVPLSFIRDSLEVEVDYDKSTGHVLITQAKKN